MYQDVIEKAKELTPYLIVTYLKNHEMICGNYLGKCLSAIIIAEFSRVKGEDIRIVGSKTQTAADIAATRKFDLSS